MLCGGFAVLYRHFLLFNKIRLVYIAHNLKLKYRQNAH